MATLEIGNGWRVTSDVFSWKLQHAHISKKGEEIVSNTTYHDSPAKAIRAHIKGRLRDSDAAGVLEILQALDSIIDELRLHLGPAIEIDNDALRKMMQEAPEHDSGLVD